MKGISCIGDGNYTRIIQLVTEHTMGNIIKTEKALGFYENVVD
jgi:hypothetical protein